MEKHKTYTAAVLQPFQLQKMIMVHEQEEVQKLETSFVVVSMINDKE